MSKAELEEIKLEQIELDKLTPVPVPGCFYMEMIPNIDTTSHSNALDADYRRIHTPIMELFPIDVLAEMKSLDSKESEEEHWLRRGTQIDTVYYQEKSDRNELLMRDEQKHTIEDMLDYQKHLQNTFEEVKIPLSDIVEEYPLVHGDDEYVLMTGDFEFFSEKFLVTSGDTSLANKCVINDMTYNSTKLHVEDKICLEIEEGKAIYSKIKYIYKLAKDS